MKRTTLTLAMIAAFFFSGVREAQAQSSSGIHLGLAGGAVLPTQNLLSWSTGYQFFAMLEYDVPASPIKLRLEGGYSGSSSASTPPRIISATRRIVSGSGNVIIVDRRSSVWPYVIVGGGVYGLRISADAYDPFGIIRQYRINIAQTVFGWNAGAGASFPLRERLKAFLEARYTHLSTAPAGPLVESGLGFFQLTAGVAF